MSLAVVTGGGSGIGAACAGQMASAGHKVVICGRRVAELQKVASSHPNITFFPCDLSTPGGVGSLGGFVRTMASPVDALVLNAGVTHPGSVGDLKLEEWDEMISVNLTSGFLLVKEFLSDLLETRGSVVAISSQAGVRASLESSGYGVSKAGVIMLMNSLVVDYGPLGLRANSVCPGWVRSEMADVEMANFTAPRGLNLEEGYQEVTRLVPAARAGEPHEVASLVSWLISSEASYVNGAVISVDGGAGVVDVGMVPYRFHVTPKL